MRHPILLTILIMALVGPAGGSGSGAIQAAGAFNQASEGASGVRRDSKTESTNDTVVIETGTRPIDGKIIVGRTEWVMLPQLDLAVPDWEALLRSAAGCYDMTGLGFLGANIVLDESRGPLLLEVNARPGLSIQIANGTGMLGRLKRIEAEPEGRDVEQRIMFSRAHFGASRFSRGEPWIRPERPGVWNVPTPGRTTPASSRPPDPPSSAAC